MNNIIFNAVSILAIGSLTTGQSQFNSVQRAMEKALMMGEAQHRAELEQNKYFHDTGVDGNHEDHSHRRMMNVFRHMTEYNTDMSNRADILLKAAQHLPNMLRTSFAVLIQDKNIQHMWTKLTRGICIPRVPNCKSSLIYRTDDGSCNNLKFPTWGMSHRDHQRYLPPLYQDDFNAPRMTGVFGKPLPSPRLISNLIHDSGHSGLREPVDSVMLFQFGQLLDHDILETPTSKGHDGVDLACCGLNKISIQKRSACFPIQIPVGDPVFFSPCMEFVRSSPICLDDCRLDRRQQLNQATSYIDAGFIYGADSNSSMILREFMRGRLRETRLGFFHEEPEPGTCMREMPGDYCMKSGDPRVHVFPGLTSMETVMLREHNRIAGILLQLNPHWNDEIVYQETRKIVAALMQHITYTEFLPKSPMFMSKYGLRSTMRGFNNVYNTKTDASTRNAFGAAAFRFAHSMIPGHLFLKAKHGKGQQFQTETTFNRPSLVLANFGQGEGHDAVSRWILTSRGTKMDQFIDPTVRDKLFLDRQGNSFDLAALNIQRGRDHGVPGYNAWRKWCGLPVAVHFGFGVGGLIDMNPESAKRMSKLYSHPNDIDLFPAGLAEQAVPGGRVGPTFACIIANQFRDFKFGDRFWYENDFRMTGFTLEQLNEIKKIRLSNVMCHNARVGFVSSNAFEIPSKRNPPLPCKRADDIDFRFWVDNRKQYSTPLLKPPFKPLLRLDYLKDLSFKL